MRILVTGGAGFIGSCLVNELLQDGDTVLVYDNFSTGRLDFLPSHHPRLTVVVGDIDDLKGLRHIVQEWQPGYVFHLAAIHYIPYCEAHRQQTLHINVEGTLTVLEACRNSNVRRIVAASSAAVYGVSNRFNREFDTPAPIDIYGISKWFDEILLRQFQRETGLSCIAARIFNVYGYHETNPHVIPEILQQLHQQQEIVLGNLDVYRDFVYVKDVAQALMALAHVSDVDFGVFNVGSGIEHSVREIVETCQRIVGRPVHVRSDAARRRQVDRPHLRADISAIQQDAGWSPRYDLEKGLSEIIQSALKPNPEPELVLA
jgi:UDP-glucose 4-epimerase